MPRHIVDELPEYQREPWRLMGRGFQDILRELAKAGTHSESGIPLTWLINMWIYQCKPGSHTALCAATGVRLTPRGILSPKIHRLDGEAGLQPENLVLVCRAYWILRRSHRVYGPAGHVRVCEWIEEAAEFIAQDERKDLAEVWWERPKGAERLEFSEEGGVWGE